VEQRVADAFHQIQTVGGPETVRTKLEDLAHRTQADELMITSNIFSHDERKRSFERVAKIFELTPGPLTTSSAE
jgi:alkanesulfonate monooxygenase SsuD/methylene tetrahydromethanopterin reductase-like flavin-dependent oxidoreductase (luciferase family)